MTIKKSINTLGGRLAHLREREDMTQKELAEALGYVKETLASWEVDRHAPNSLVIIDYSTYFNVSCDWILKGE